MKPDEVRRMQARAAAMELEVKAQEAERRGDLERAAFLRERADALDSRCQWGDV